MCAASLFAFEGKWRKKSFVVPLFFLMYHIRDDYGGALPAL
jgi:hypothetical protein